MRPAAVPHQHHFSFGERDCAAQTIHKRPSGTMGRTTMAARRKNAIRKEERASLEAAIATQETYCLDVEEVAKLAPESTLLLRTAVEEEEQDSHEEDEDEDEVEEVLSVADTTTSGALPEEDDINASPFVEMGSTRYLGQNLLCSSCNQVLVEATMLVPCKHVFCLSCISCTTTLLKCRVCEKLRLADARCHALDNIVWCIATNKVLSEMIFTPAEIRDYSKRLKNTTSDNGKKRAKPTII